MCPSVSLIASGLPQSFNDVRIDKTLAWGGRNASDIGFGDWKRRSSSIGSYCSNSELLHSIYPRKYLHETFLSAILTCHRWEQMTLQEDVAGRNSSECYGGGGGAHSKIPWCANRSASTGSNAYGFCASIP